MTGLAKHDPLENLRSCDRSMQLPSCADGCLAGDVYFGGDTLKPFFDRLLSVGLI